MKTLFLIAAAAVLTGASARTTAREGSGPAAARNPPPTLSSRPPRSATSSISSSARYGASDKEAIARCATAALADGAILYGVNGYAGTDGYAGYVGAYRPGAAALPGFPGIATTMRVSGITDVQRRRDDSGVDYRSGYGGEANRASVAAATPTPSAIPATTTSRSAAISIRPSSSAACMSNGTPRPTAAIERAQRA